MTARASAKRIVTQPNVSASWSKATRLGPTGALLLCCTVSGCGLIFNGRTQTVMIRSVPSGAVASFAGHEVITPGEVTVSRKFSKTVLRAEKDHYQPECQVVRAPRNFLYFILDIIPAGLPLLVDIAADTLRQFPDEIYLTLEPLSPGATPRTLPPDQAVLDAWDRSGTRVNLCNPYLEDTRRSK